MISINLLGFFVIWLVSYAGKVGLCFLMRDMVGTPV